MSTYSDSNRQVIAFNKKGDKAGTGFVPELIYLKTEKEWIDEHLRRSPQLDGLAILIDWETREIKTIKYAEDN